MLRKGVSLPACSPSPCRRPVAAQCSGRSLDMDGHTQRKSALLRNFTASISQDAIAQLTEQQTADICRALVSARVLADETLTAPSRRAEAAQAIDIWFSALSKGLQTVPQVGHRKHRLQ